MELVVDYAGTWFLLPSVKLLLSLRTFFHNNRVLDHHPQSILESSDIVDMWSWTYMEMLVLLHL